MRATAIIISAIIFLAAPLGVALAAPEAVAPADDAGTVGRTPPRLSYLDGQVSFWRPGADDWVQAQMNTALAPGDQLYIQGDGNLELQVGARAFVRGGADAQIGLETQEPDFLRFKVISGQVSFDLRTLNPGRTVEVNTPHGAFTIDHQGYYRLDVDDARTTFIARRSGRATAVAADGQAVPLEPDEAVTLQNSPDQTFAFQAAPALDDWDNWNYARTDDLLAARSLRYISPGTYGAADLDRYGSWRVLPTYGPVWVPAGVAPGWAPYSTGSWMHDPYFGWTWVDTAPWGWAPYHYGRWVYVNSSWCWAPGPVVVRPYYAPALVAFYGSPSVSIGIRIGGPGVGWVALGWGEPLIPWWGRVGFIHRPWWGGWGGPRYINNRVVYRRTVVRVNDIHVYANSRVRGALVVVDKDHFGRGRIRHDHRRYASAKDWRPIHRAPDIRPGARSYVPSDRRGIRPTDKHLKRAVVTFDPNKRYKSVAIREPRAHARSEVRSVEDRGRFSRQGSRRDVQLPAKKRAPSIEAPPARIQNAPRVYRNNGRSNPQVQPHRAPATDRPAITQQRRSASRTGSKAESGIRPMPSAGSGNRAIKPSSPVTTDASPSFNRPSTSGGRGMQSHRRESPPAVPGFTRQHRGSIQPASPAPEVRVPRRQAPQRGVDAPPRVSPTPGTNSPSVSPGRVPRVESGVYDNGRPSGRGNAGAWRHSERPGRGEVNRGADFNARGKFGRHSRN